MSCSVFIHIKYSKELEEKIRKMHGIILLGLKYTDFESVQVPESLFPQHKKEVEAHKWVKEKNGDYGHYPENFGNWE